MAKVARMYHERGIKQPQIASDLHISQSRVSRLLTQAAEAGIVRTIVTLPADVHTDVEEHLEKTYGLVDSVVVDAEGALGDVIPALGAAAATYLGETFTGGDRVGISSWSASLLATVDALRPRYKTVVDLVAQLVGGLGDPQVQVAATRLLDRLATTTGAQPLFLPTPASVPDPGDRAVYLRDPATLKTQAAWSALTVALVGIGSVEPSPMLRSSGNAVNSAQQEQLRDLGAVGDVLLRYFDSQGELIESDFNDSVLGISPESFMQIPRRIGVAGGGNKVDAIRAAVRGRWINVLITDVETATAMLRAEESA
ncbi:sugar-binding transcriptional regulator [Arsenicicoccus bolidensis]|uniref:sugar-binding transcriptional regulator n=1 Tax=Arsenicicoccus bolidensis TaxID=229480 RepID=UPI0003F58606|nr:sugar-binding domain-containing protein [Arsenicicoccus bolidensis]